MNEEEHELNHVVTLDTETLARKALQFAYSEGFCEGRRGQCTTDMHRATNYHLVLIDRIRHLLDPEGDYPYGRQR